MNAPTGDDDLLLRVLRDLPPLAPADRVANRVAARATEILVTRAARQRRALEKASRAARPLLPLSLAGMSIGYLLWVCQQITGLWR